MSEHDPEQAILYWLENQDHTISVFLVRSYIFMTSHQSDDFTLNDQESLIHFQHLMTQTDLPQRRIARILSVRTLFSFLLNNSDLQTTDAQIHSIQLAHQLKARQGWQQFCQEQLDDYVLLDWLRLMKA